MPPIEITPKVETWLNIVRFALQEVAPLWEAHKRKTIEQFLGLDEGEPIEVLPAEAMVKDIVHWWEVPTHVLENYVDAGLGNPRKAKWRVVIEGKKTYYQVEPKQS